jgi:hypothetical protein
MSRQRFLLITVAALLAIASALMVATQRNSSREAPGVALFPSLAADLNQVSEVRIAKGAPAPLTTLDKAANGWTVKERGGYPADVAKLRKLLTSLADAKILEEKTADPARYPVIGVEDLTQSGSTGTEVTVLTPHGAQALIIGKSVAEGTFVRRAGDKQSYSVEPGITVETEPHFWIDSRLLDVPAAKIQSIAFKPADGTAYVIRRTATDAFSLEGAPADRKPLDASALAPAQTTFTSLTAEDVAAVEGVDFGKPFVVTLTLTDGEVVTLTGAVAGAKHWVQVSSSKDATLTARTQGRAFEVPSYRYDAIFKPLDQLLVAKAPAPGKAAPGGMAAPPPAGHAPKQR